MNLTKNLTALGTSCVLIGLLSACNTEQLPNGANIRVSPENKKIKLSAADPNQPTGCFIDPDTLYQDVPVLITVTNDQGSPLGDIEVGVYADYSGNTFSGPEVLQVYADKNGNGVVDGENELVSGSESGVYETKTDKFHGTAMVFVRMNLTCPYNGQLYVYAGPDTATVEFEVQHEGAGAGGTSTSGTSTGGATGGGKTDGSQTGGVTGGVTAGGIDRSDS